MLKLDNIYFKDKWNNDKNNDLFAILCYYKFNILIIYYYFLISYIISQILNLRLIINIGLCNIINYWIITVD